MAPKKNDKDPIGDKFVRDLLILNFVLITLFLIVLLVIEAWFHLA